MSPEAMDLEPMAISTSTSDQSSWVQRFHVTDHSMIAIGHSLGREVSLDLVRGLRLETICILLLRLETICILFLRLETICILLLRLETICILFLRLETICILLLRLETICILFRVSAVAEKHLTRRRCTGRRASRTHPARRGREECGLAMGRGRARKVLN
jgi:hypothetical protein